MRFVVILFAALIGWGARGFYDKPAKPTCCTPLIYNFKRDSGNIAARPSVVALPPDCKATMIWDEPTNTISCVDGPEKQLFRFGSNATAEVTPLGGIGGGSGDTKKTGVYGGAKR